MSHQLYSDALDESNPSKLPNVEVFHSSECAEMNLAEGWYWWACFPGCLPDSEAIGPFNSEKEAEEDSKVDPEQCASCGRVILSGGEKFCESCAVRDCEKCGNSFQAGEEGEENCPKCNS